MNEAREVVKWRMSTGNMRNSDQSKAFHVMMVLSYFLLAQAVVCGAESNGAPGTQPDNSIKIGERYLMRSAILQEDRPYLVYLPQSYQSNEFAPQRYPVLYLLD